MAGDENNTSQWPKVKHGASVSAMDSSNAIVFPGDKKHFSSHASDLHNDIQQDTVRSISCQQLLMKASQGLLPHMDLMCTSFKQDYSGTVNKQPTDDRYAGIDSEQETDGYQSDGGFEDEGYGADEEEPVDNFRDQYSAIDDYICQFDDTITKEDFYNERDPFDDYIERGIDDTDMTGIEVEVDEELTESSTILDIEENNCALPDTESSASPILGGCGCAHPEIAQEISKKHIEEVALGYKKRNKKFKDDSGTDCRTARDIGAIEIALRTRCHRKTERIFEPILGMVFDSKEEAYEFYNLYSWEVGFGIIYNRNRSSSSDEKKHISMQEIICQKGGHDPRIIRSTRKEQCKARIVLLRNGDGGWYVTTFVKEHCHQMAETYAEKREFGSHKRLDPYTLNVIKYLRRNNVTLTQVRCIVGSMFGSLKDAPCTKRSLRTICSQIAREQMDNDIAKTLEIFKEMKANDPAFQWSVERGENNTIKTLMWCSGKSRELYACFGDVVTFDTTYCTNFYKMPFGLFVGVNNHFQTIIYAGVLMKEETIESFKWVFNEFLKLMGGKAPQTVFTDQCKSMTIALGEVWIETFHLWCKWHVMKRIREGLGPTYTKNAIFRDEFYTIANEMLTKEEFVMAWEDLCERYNLTKNAFMIRTFQCRMKWARPWAKGHYCAGMTSTQRSESANMMLKKFVPRNSSLNQFVSQYNVLLQDRDMEEGRQEDQTKQLVMKYSRMWPIERHALKIYTKASFMLFRKQVDKASSFVVSGKGENFYVVSHNSPGERPKWAKVDFKVFVLDDGARYCCDCGFYEHLGILCCHILRLMIRLDIGKIPKAHIMTRWTRNAKDVLPEHLKGHQKDTYVTKPLTLQSMQLNAKALQAVSKGNTDIETLQVVMKHFNAAIKEVDEILRARKQRAEVASEVTDTNTACDDTDDGLGIQTDTEGFQGNRYGASGSSAGMSDSEILNLKAPIANRSRGRPRVNRYRTQAGIATKKLSKKPTDRSRVAKAKRTEDLTTSTTATKQAKRQRKSNEEKTSLEENRGLPYQSRFCSKCHLPGHDRRTCGRPGKKNKNDYRCSKCDLKGHIEEDCLVVEDDPDSFFK